MNIYFRSAGATLKINVNDEIGKELLILKFAFDYIPDLSIVTEEVAFDGQVDLIEGNPFFFGFDGSIGKIKFDIDKNLGIKDLVTLLEYCLEYLRQMKGVYCLHGSAVSINGKGVWFMGPVSGLGKTTVALNMCLEGGAKFIGDEKILLGSNIQIIGGVKNVNYNKEALVKSLPVDFDNKTSEDLSKFINMEGEPVPLEFIVLPLLFEGSGKIETEKWEINKASFHLYEEMSRKIRGGSRRIQNSTVPIPSIDTMEISVKRSDLANKIVDNVPIYFMKGNLEEIIKKILEVIDGDKSKIT